jgi:hypothetical protein
MGITGTMGGLWTSGLASTLSPRTPLRLRDSASPQPQGRQPGRRRHGGEDTDPALAMTQDVVEGVFALLDNKAINGIDLELDGGIQLV